jgi:pimeloyl-ACP methyl ester carboxylesterase
LAAVRPLLLALVAMALPAAADAPAGRTGLESDVAFADYSPLSRSAELARRSLSPLSAIRLRQQAAAAGSTIPDQPIDLAKERFTLYVPGQAPPQGYALLVFVSPWPGATVPSRWPSVLDRRGMIFVVAANAGNDMPTRERREPLALLAAHNVMKHYRVDGARVYVGGFSGGSRVALRTALAYPDLFHGALLDAGSDPIGAAIPPPPAELFRQFQEATRLVYLTGARDDAHVDADNGSLRSLPDWCVFDVEALAMPWTGHDLADPASLDRALDALDRHNPPDPGRLAECRTKLDAELAGQAQQVEALAAAGRSDQAWRALAVLDARYGGLAAERSIELASRLGAGP